MALRERLVVVHHSLVTSTGRHGLLDLYYLKHIAWDLKSALKAKALGKSYQETLEFLDMKAEELVGRRDLIVKAFSAKDVNEAVSLLAGTEFYDDIEKARTAFAASGEVRFFDIYIDHAVLAGISKEYASNYPAYSSSRATDVAGVGDIVANDVDAYNVLSVLRSKLWGLPEQEIRSLIITPTYRIPSSVLLRMKSSESTSVAVKLIEPVYSVDVQAAQNDEELIEQVEDNFTKEMKETATKAFYWQGLSLGIALDLVKLLEFEVSNLAAIAIGVEAKMDPKNILNKLRL